MTESACGGRAEDLSALLDQQPDLLDGAFRVSSLPVCFTIAYSLKETGDCFDGRLLWGPPGLC